MKTRDLIQILVEDRAAGSPRPAGAVALAIGLGSFAAAAIFWLAIGPRVDFAQAVETGRFLFKFVLTLALAVSATGLILRLSRPDAVSGAWSWALLAAPVMLIMAILAELAVMPAATWAPRLIGSNSLICLTYIPLLSLAPLIGLVAALRQGAPAHPGWAGAAAGLAASGIGATLYAAHCTDDSPLFVATWYTLAISAVTLAGYLIGRRWLRW